MQKSSLMNLVGKTKKQHSTAIVFFGINCNFYQCFYEDAKKVSHLLNTPLINKNGITLTGLTKKELDTSMKYLLKSLGTIVISENQYMKNIAKNDLWNRLIKVRDTTRFIDIKHESKLLLDQLNTAGGKEMMREEITNFLNKYDNVIK